MADPIDDYLAAIQGESHGGFSSLPVGTLSQLYVLDAGVFRRFFEIGFGDEYRYRFLEERPDLLLQLSEAGFVQIPGEYARRTGCELWMLVDRVVDPGVAIIVELPEQFKASHHFLQLMVLPHLRQLQYDRSQLPSWIEALLPSVFRSRSPLVLVSEEGSGRHQLLSLLETYRFGSSVVKFQPGRMAEQVQLREFFGDDIGERLRSTQALPVVQRGNVILVEEAANLAPALQRRLLDELQRSGRFWIFETSRDLDAMVDSQSFDKTLGRILGEHRIVLPPLRQQKSSLRQEVDRLLAELVSRHYRYVQISDSAVESILQYDWPGNLQELYATIESAYLLCRHETIEPSDLHLGLWYQGEGDRLNIRHRTWELERDLLLQAHAIHGGNQVHMATALGLSRGSLQYRWNRLGLQEGKDG